MIFLEIIGFIILGVFILGIFSKVEGWLIDYGAPPPKRKPKEKP